MSHPTILHPIPSHFIIIIIKPTECTKQPNVSSRRARTLLHHIGIVIISRSHTQGVAAKKINIIKSHLIIQFAGVRAQTGALVLIYGMLHHPSTQPPVPPQHALQCLLCLFKRSCFLFIICLFHTHTYTRAYI